METLRFARRIAPAIALAATLAGLAPQFARAGDSAANFYAVAPGETHKSLQLGVGRSVIVDLPQDATEIFVGDPKIANAVVRSARRLYVAAVANGQTTIFALAGDGRKIATIEVTVGRDIGELQQLLNAALPGNDITVKTVADSIILMGSVASAGDAQKALDIASGFVGTSVLGGSPTSQAPAAGAGTSVQLSVAPSGTPLTGKVINSLTIRGLDQVALKVTISEVRRDIVKQLGVTLGGSSGANSFSTDNPFSVNGGAQGGGAASLGWSVGSASLKATLDAFEREGVAHTLAEPTVTAVSGESAKFLAGGTIPILNGETCNANNTQCIASIVQQPYGVTLNFTPVVLSPSRIQLHIATEVTDIDTSHSFSLANQSAVPGFRTRKNETTVELPSGGSIASAGLISTQTQQAINGVPGLMNVPILGALFRSRDYLSQETELMIIVTPYIVHAIDPRDAVRPDANFQDSSDPQAWLLGHVNRIYSSSRALQPVPGYNGRVGFITD